MVAVTTSFTFMATSGMVTLETVGRLASIGYLLVGIAVQNRWRLD
jgi:hypothetical protein